MSDAAGGGGDGGAAAGDMRPGAMPDLRGVDAATGGWMPAPQNGVATYYAATGAGACSFDATPGDLDVAAMNAPQYASSAVCGTCVRVTGPKGMVNVRIVDLCPECATGHLDLSQQAFAKIADLAAGKVNVTWQAMPCAVTGPVSYRIKEGSSQWWTAIQVRNHRLPIKSLEWRKAGGAWTSISRESYNYFVIASGVGTGAFDVRATAIDGQALVDTIPQPQPGAVFAGKAQFQ